MEKDDIQRLTELTGLINEYENTAKQDLMAPLLAPRLAFQRADPAATVDDQVAFIQKMKTDRTRTVDKIDPIQLYGNRAIVSCIISVDGKPYHNLRLFVRRDGDWKLLGWANEPA